VSNISNELLTISILAAANLDANRFAGFGGNLCAANAKAAGVVQLDTASGSYAPVMSHGVAVVESGGIFAVGDELVSDSTGRAVKATDVSVASVLTVTASVPSGATPVTSTGAQPSLSPAGTSANTVAGSALPQKINGTALEASSGAGEFVRVVLR